MSYTDGGSDEPLTAWLFQLDETPVHAVTTDASGSVLPREQDHEWRRREQFTLGVQHALPLSFDPEPILRAITAQGYFLWNAAEIQQPVSTSQ